MFQKSHSSHIGTGLLDSVMTAVSVHKGEIIVDKCSRSDILVVHLYHMINVVICVSRAS